ncbi:MAG: PEP/pyruvate-binding domain-containing protein [Chlamydiota bacterium]
MDSQILRVVSAREQDSFTFSSLRVHGKRIYGNKHEKLAKLANIFVDNPIDGVQIPIFKGICHESVKAFLQNKDPSIFFAWEELASSYAKYANPTDFIQDPSTVRSLEAIQTKIKTAFQNMTLKDLTHFDNDLSSWLGKVKDNDSKLMVRSSGLEDHEDFVNAGGNVSEAYVSPELSDIFLACGNVVASYFALPSLKNRIAAKINPFSSEPILSVVLQELIGESIGGSREVKQIPASLVLFTHEPNESEQDFFVTKISATFGHGTGVVSSCGVNSDTIHVVNSRIHFDKPLESYQNRVKENRLVPVLNSHTGSIELSLIANPIELQEKRALSSEMIVRLMSLVKFIEKTFMNQAVDVEIIIRNDIIYIVQARPIVREKIAPTYIADELLYETFPNLKETARAEVLVLGKGEVKIIRNSEEILLCDSLAEAEEKYIRGVHTTVIVEKKEPANSHPVVNFSSLGVLSLRMESLFTLKSVVQKITEGNPLVICPQSGRLWLWQEKALKADDFIKLGYYSHPAIRGIYFESPSVISSYSSKYRENLPPEILKAIVSLQEAKTTEIAKKALLEIQSFIPTKSYTYSKKTDKMIDLFTSKVQETVREIEKSCEEDAPRLEKMFHIKTLSTLLAKQPKDALHAYSLLDVYQAKRQTEEMLHYETRRIKQSLFATESKWKEFLPLKDHAISSNGADQWEKFLLKLETFSDFTGVGSKKQLFEKLLNQLVEYEALPTFMNLIALPLLTKKEKMGRTWFEFLGISYPALEVISELANSFTQSDEAILQVLDEKNKRLSRARHNLFLFSNPKTFDEGKKELLELLSFFSDKSEFLIPMKESSNLTKLLAMHCLEEVVEVTDLAIKAMKASSDFTVEEKVIRLRSLLNSNLDLLAAWVEFKGIFRSSYHLSFLRTCLNEKMRSNEEYLLFPSKDFSVEAALIENHAAIERHAPKTLEDIFTLIHQNQISMVKAITRVILPSECINNSTFSPLLTAALEEFGEIRQCSDYLLDRNCTISLKDSGISFSYNIPLNNHSARFSLEYQKDSSLVFHGKFFGEARNRWATFANWINILDEKQKVKLIGPVISTKQELIFSWKLTNLNEIALAKVMFQGLLWSSSISNPRCEVFISDLKAIENSKDEVISQLRNALDLVDKVS